MGDLKIEGVHGCRVTLFTNSDLIEISVWDMYGFITKEQAKQLGEWLIKQSDK